MKQLFLFLLIGLIGFSSCKEEIATADALNLVPATVSSVTAVRLDRLMDKADFENVKNMEFYQDMLSEVEDPAMTAILRNPAESGIALEHPLYLTYDINPQDFEEILIVGVATLADASKFEAALSDVPGDTESGEGFSYRQMDRQALVAWNDAAVLVMSSPGYLNLKEKAAAWFAGTEGEAGVAAEKTLRDIMGKDADITTWSSLNALSENMQVKMMAGMMQIPAEALKGNYATSFTNFEKGQISSFGYLDFNDDLTKDIRRLVKNEVDTDFEDYIPADNLTFALTAALSAEGIDEILANNPMYRGFADQALAEFGTNSTDLLSAFDGDIMVTGHTVPGQMVPELSFATKLGDMDNFGKVLQFLTQSGIFTATGENTYTVQKSTGFGNAFVRIEDDMLFIADNEGHLNRMADEAYRGSDLVKGEAKEWLDGHISGLFLNFESLFGSMGTSDVEPVAKTLDNLVMGVDRDESEMHLNLKRDDVNSLKALFEMANEIYLQEKM